MSTFNFHAAKLPVLFRIEVCFNLNKLKPTLKLHILLIFEVIIEYLELKHEENKMASHNKKIPSHFDKVLFPL